MFYSLWQAVYKVSTKRYLGLRNTLILRQIMDSNMPKYGKVFMVTARNNMN
jgi:hypothetical protein